jgi:hypothetical protein
MSVTIISARSACASRAQVAGHISLSAHFALENSRWGAELDYQAFHYTVHRLRGIAAIRSAGHHDVLGRGANVGGIDAKTAPLAVAAGANVLVAGTAIFGESEGVAAAMKRLRAAILQA